MSAEDVRATDAEIAEVLRLDREATPGPWAVTCEGRRRIAVRPTIIALVQGGEPPIVASCVDHAPGDARLICLARALFSRVARELMALREQHRAADEALTRCGIEATSPRDTLADRLLRVVTASNDDARRAQKRRDTLAEKANKLSRAASRIISGAPGTPVDMLAAFDDAKRDLTEETKR